VYVTYIAQLYAVLLKMRQKARQLFGHQSDGAGLTLMIAKHPERIVRDFIDDTPSGQVVDDYLSGAWHNSLD
jgi:hypothetical protein